MKKAIICLLLCHTAVAVGPDKALHAGVAYALTIAGSAALRAVGLNPMEALAVSLVAVAAASTAKEITDRRFDGGDVAADAVGMAFGACVVIGFGF